MSERWKTQDWKMSDQTAGLGKTIGLGENPSDSCIFIATDVDRRAFCEVSLPAVA